MTKKLKDYLYYSENGIRLYNADCSDVMQKLPDNYVDLICTDPPYGYSFMGKDWDKVVIPSSTWKECLRVLKPGAFAFIMSAPRQDVLSRMIINLQDAGFETGFSSIYWSYATGFPKANNISKFVDKQECKKELTEKLGRKPTKKEFDKAWENYRKIIKERPTSVFKTEDGWHDSPMNNPDNVYKYTEAKSPQAKELDGSYAGFQPKPAVEIIIVAMKPIDEKTYVDQALKNGKGITWLDNCRIPHNEEQKETKRKSRNENQTFSNKSCGFKSENLTSASANPKGRFPANLLVSDDVLNDGKISKSSKSKANYEPSKPANIPAGCAGGTIKSGVHYGDSGSYSRYFNLDSWWIERVKQLPPEVQKVFPYLIVPKASKSEKNKGCEILTDKIYNDETRLDKDAIGCNNPRNRSGTAKSMNHHPTVKPLKLMSYIITLGSREGDIVLDPFTGSGTTLIASKLLNRKGIGIEMSSEYCNIAKARIKGSSK